MEIYEKIRYYREHTDYSQRNVAKILGVSRNTVKKYWEGITQYSKEILGRTDGSVGTKARQRQEERYHYR